MGQWQIVFCIAAGIYIFCGLFYIVFGSGARQEWDNPLLDDPNNQIIQVQNGNTLSSNHGPISETRH